MINSGNCATIFNEYVDACVNKEDLQYHGATLSVH